MLAIYLVLLSVSMYSAAAIIRKKISAVDDDLNYIFSVAFQFLGGICTIFFSLIFGLGGEYQHFFSSLTLLLVLKFFIGSILWFSSTVLSFKALNTVSASKYSIIEALSPVVSVTLAFVLLGESLTALQFVGMVIILISVFAVVYDKNAEYSRLSKGELIAIFSTALAGLALVNDKGIYLATPLAPTLAVEFLLPGLLGVIARPRELKKVKVILKKKAALKQLLIMSAIWSVAALFYYKAIVLSNSLSLVVSMSQLSVILTVFLGLFVLKETKNWPIKVVASIASVIGFILMSR